jgi:hypothetical protein
MTLKYLTPFWEIVKNWWWVIPPFILWRPFLFLWLWFRQEKWAKDQKFIMLEIKMPREVKRPFRAMEQVFAGWWMLYDPADWWEKWIEGKYQFSMSIELVSDGGEIHFYLRIPETARNFVESSIYSQYPDVEIAIADDYTKDIPSDIPNEWDLWGCDYELIKPDVYPIKTYSQFFEESQALKEEKRIDPLAALLEGMTKLKPGEKIWVQMRLTPVTNAENNYKDRAKELTAKLLRRPSPPKKKAIIQEAIDTLLFGPASAQPKKGEELIPPEMGLSPGEREIVSAIEKKISKTMFECGIRFIILGKKGVLYKPNLKTVLGYFANFNTENLNGLKPWGPSITKIHKHEKLFLNIFFHDSLLYLKKRKILNRYISRLDYLYPAKGKSFVLNIEELATMFHFVGREAVPAPIIQRVESKKSEPPPNLPVG